MFVNGKDYNEFVQIYEDEDLTIKEKIDLCVKLRKEKYDNAEVACDVTLKAIKKGYKHCPKCDDWYRENTFEHTTKELLEEYCTNQLTGGYLEDYEYEDIYRTYAYDICPKGHWIQGKCIDWRYPTK